jgi:hypothetical protein
MSEAWASGIQRYEAQASGIQRYEAQASGMKKFEGRSSGWFILRGSDTKSHTCGDRHGRCWAFAGGFTTCNNTLKISRSVCKRKGA